MPARLIREEKCGMNDVDDKRPIYCEEKGKEVTIHGQHPYGHFLKTFSKERDEFPSFFCEEHCYTGSNTPPKCAYRKL